MDNIKTKELELLQTLSKLDLFTDLVANSKKKIVYAGLLGFAQGVFNICKNIETYMAFNGLYLPLFHQLLKR